MRDEARSVLPDRLPAERQAQDRQRQIDEDRAARKPIRGGHQELPALRPAEPQPQTRPPEQQLEAAGGPAQLLRDVGRQVLGPEPDRQRLVDVNRAQTARGEVGREHDVLGERVLGEAPYRDNRVTARHEVRAATERGAEAVAPARDRAEEKSLLFGSRSRERPETGVAVDLRGLDDRDVRVG